MLYLISSLFVSVPVNVKSGVVSEVEPASAGLDRETVGEC